MFTGIIEQIGQVTSVRETTGGWKLSVQSGAIVEDAKLGASVAINGVCLTISEIKGDILVFDAVSETLQRSNLNTLRPGSPVNMERALLANGRLDGHIVQGHVDGNAVLLEKKETPEECRFWFAPDQTLMPYMIPKGSIALDGISLTLADVRPDRISVALIPTTLRETTLATRSTGDVLNVETDILARTIIHTLERMNTQSPDSSGGLTLERLRENGFA